MDTYTGIALANAAVALVSGISSVVGMARPAMAVPDGGQITAGTTFFAYAYGARAVPLSIVLLILLAAGARGALAPILVVAGLAQLGDAGIGAGRRNWPMAVNLRRTGGGAPAVRPVDRRAVRAAAPQPDSRISCIR